MAFWLVVSVALFCLVEAGQWFFQRGWGIEVGTLPFTLGAGVLLAVASNYGPWRRGLPQASQPNPQPPSTSPASQPPVPCAPRVQPASPAVPAAAPVEQSLAPSFDLSQPYAPRQPRDGSPGA